VLPSARQHLYLRLIAALKIAKGLLLLGVAVALLFLDVRHTWFEQVVDWVEAEMMLPHYNLVLIALRWIEEFLAGTQLRSIGLLALVYAAVLMTEGIGVWFEKRWAEWLMVLATGSLIPLEVIHLFHRLSLTKLSLVAANIAIVVYLARLLRRPGHHQGWNAPRR
jgi:uncharacterized membrane protein (DUF2068 family)